MVQFNFNDMNAYGGRGKFGGKPPVKPAAKITLEDLKVLALKYKIEAICVAVFLAGLIAVWSFFSSQMLQITTLTADIQLLADKEQSVTTLIKKKQEDQELQSSLPPVLESDKRIITYLTSLAMKRNIKITSMSPPKEKFGGFFRRKTIDLTCSADIFQSILLFLNDIEQSKYALKVDSWSVIHVVESSRDMPGRRARSDGGEPVNEPEITKLILSMTVSSIEIIGNEKKSN